MIGWYFWQKGHVVFNWPICDDQTSKLTITEIRWPLVIFCIGTIFRKINNQVIKANEILCIKSKTNKSMFLSCTRINN